MGVECAEKYCVSCFMSFHQKGALKKHNTQTLEQVRTVILSSTAIIHIYHFDTLSLAVWQDTCHTYKNLVYDLAHHKSPIAQWLERPTGIWKVIGFDSRWGLRKFFFWVFRLEKASSLFTLYPSHQSIYQELWHVFSSCDRGVTFACLPSNQGYP